MSSQVFSSGRCIDRYDIVNSQPRRSCCVPSHYARAIPRLCCITRARRIARREHLTRKFAEIKTRARVRINDLSDLSSYSDDERRQMLSVCVARFSTLLYRRTWLAVRPCIYLLASAAIAFLPWILRLSVKLCDANFSSLFVVLLSKLEL